MGPWRENGFSREWAEQAAKMLFKEAEVPEEDKAVSFTMLCLYWYGQGDWQRSVVHEGNAQIHLRLTCPPRTFENSEHSLSAELKCRRFWAAYIINQFVSEQTAGFSRTTISHSRLPCPEDQFDGGAISSSKATIQDEIRTPSLYSEVVLITNLW